MNIGQNANITSNRQVYEQKGNPSPKNSALDFEQFSNQLFLAQNKGEWFIEGNSREEQKRLYNEQIKDLRETEDLKDDLNTAAFSQQVQAKTDSNAGFVEKQTDFRKARYQNPALEGAPDDSIKSETTNEQLDTKELEAQANGKKQVDKSTLSFKQLLEGKPESNSKTPAPETQPIQQNDSKISFGDLTKSSESPEKAPLKFSQVPPDLKTNRVEPKAKIISNNTKTGLTDLVKGEALEASQKSFSRQLKTKIAESPRTDQLKEPVSTKDVQNNIRYMLSNDRTEMTIRLIPANLGKMEIMLRKNGEKMIGRFKVENKQAREALESKLSTLKEGLEEQGIKIDEFVFLVNGDKSNRDSAPQRDQIQKNNMSFVPRQKPTTGNKQNSQNTSDLNVFI